MNRPKTSIELIPRNYEYLKNKIEAINDGNYDMINLPHLRDRINTKGEKIEFLSPEEIASIKSKILPYGKELILHLRTQDSKTVGENLERIKNLQKSKIKEILLITGDSYTKKTPILKTDTLLKNIKIQKDISVCCDLYIEKYGRFKKKKHFLQKNSNANIYTQPVFHVETLEMLKKEREKLGLPQKNHNIYAGVTWICNDKSRKYWSEVNHIPEKYLPKGHSNQMIKENSIAQAIDILKYIQKEEYSSYIMLMQLKVEDLLHIQNKSTNLN